MTSFSLDPTLWGLIGQFWTWVMADSRKIHTQKKQPLDKTQSSELCQLGVKRTRFQNRKEKRKWFFDHITTFNFHRIGLGLQHVCRYTVLGHQKWLSWRHVKTPWYKPGRGVKKVFSLWSQTLSFHASLLIIIQSPVDYPCLLGKETRSFEVARMEAES